MNIGIIGAGNVGGTLGRRWAQKGHGVKFGVRDSSDPKLQELLAQSGANATAGTVGEAAAYGEIIVFATPWSAVQEAITSAGDLTGKIVVDCTNPIKADFSGLEFGHTTSAGEQVAAWATGAKVVKCFNTTGANIMASPQFGDQSPAMFLCGDDTDAKAQVAQLAADLDFVPVDAGPLEQARLLEAMAWLWITMALKYGQGREMAFALLKR